MFIVFEGIDGSSKSTQSRLLSSWLNKIGINNLLTKEPGSPFSDECKNIRQVLLNPKNDLSSRAELFLYLADRAQHVDKIITPTLIDRNLWVISDRYTFSTYAYQGYGREHIYIGQSDWFKQSLEIACYGVMPHVLFILDLPVEISLQRAKKSNTEFEGGDRLEREKSDFYQRIREGFLKQAESLKNNDFTECVVLDATKTIEELHEEVKEVLRKKAPDAYKDMLK